MKPKHEHTWAAVAQGGSPHLEDVAAYRTWFAKTFGDGEEIEVIVRRRKRHRSSPANRYWWGVVMRVLCEDLGYADPDELHDAIVYKFRPADPDPLTGAPRRQRTSAMTSDEFGELISDVRMWAEADLGIYIPLPNEVAA